MTDLKTRKDKAAEWAEMAAKRPKICFTLRGLDAVSFYDFKLDDRGELVCPDVVLDRKQSLALAAWIIETFAEPGKDGG